MKYKVSFNLELNKNPYEGLFVALEGIDASGKSTQIKLLKKQFENDGKKVFVKHPFEGEIGEFIRKILSGEKKISTDALQYLISANRHVQQEEIINELKKGNNVLIDRYVFSAVVYGMFDKGTDLDEAENLLLVEQSILSMYHKFLMPDTSFYLKISADHAVERLDKMDKQKELIYEEEGKMRKIAEIYDKVVGDFSEEFQIIDAEQSITQITDDIMSRIRKMEKYK